MGSPPGLAHQASINTWPAGSEANSLPKGKLLSREVMKVLDAYLEHDRIPVILSDMRVLNRDKNTNYGPNKVKDVKAPIDLYRHMARCGDIKDQKGRENFENLMMVLRNAGADECADELQKRIDEHTQSPTARREMYSIYSIGSQDSVTGTPMTASSNKSEEALFLSPDETRNSQLKRPMVEDVEPDGGQKRRTADMDAWPPGKTPKIDLASYFNSLEEYKWREDNGKQLVGLVAIINQFTEPRAGYDFRNGTIEDEERIKNVLFTSAPYQDYYKLHEDKVQRDLNYGAMNSYLISLRDHLKNNPHDYSSFTLFIMSHGNKDGIFTHCSHSEAEEEPQRHNYSVEKLTELFDAVLKDKPKVIVVQACKGNSGNVQIDNMGQEVNAPQIVKDIPFRPKLGPPKSADMLVAYSTVPGYASLRVKAEGSWFIQLLMNCFERAASDRLPNHLIDVLTATQREVSELRNTVQGQSGLVAQMPYFQSSLRSKFFILPLSHWTAKF